MLLNIRKSILARAVALMALFFLLAGDISWAYEDSSSLAVQSIFKPLFGGQIKDIGIIRYYLYSLASSFNGLRAPKKDVNITLADKSIDLIIRFSQTKQFDELFGLKNGEYVIPCLINGAAYYSYFTSAAKGEEGALTVFTRQEFEGVKARGVIYHKGRSSPEAKRIVREENSYRKPLDISNDTVISSEEVWPLPGGAAVFELEYSSEGLKARRIISMDGIWRDTVSYGRIRRMERVPVSKLFTKEERALIIEWMKANTIEPLSKEKAALAPSYPRLRIVLNAVALKDNVPLRYQNLVYINRNDVCVYMGEYLLKYILRNQSRILQRSVRLSRQPSKKDKKVLEIAGHKAASWIEKAYRGLPESIAITNIFNNSLESESVLIDYCKAENSAADCLSAARMLEEFAGPGLVERAKIKRQKLDKLIFKELDEDVSLQIEFFKRFLKAGLIDRSELSKKLLSCPAAKFKDSPEKNGRVAEWLAAMVESGLVNKEAARPAALEYAGKTMRKSAFSDLKDINLSYTLVKGVADLARADLIDKYFFGSSPRYLKAVMDGFKASQASKPADIECPIRPVFAELLKGLVRAGCLEKKKIIENLTPRYLDILVKESFDSDVPANGEDFARTLAVFCEMGILDKGDVRKKLLERLHLYVGYASLNSYSKYIGVIKEALEALGKAGVFNKNDFRKNDIRCLLKAIASSEHFYCGEIAVFFMGLANAGCLDDSMARLIVEGFISEFCDEQAYPEETIYALELLKILIGKGLVSKTYARRILSKTLLRNLNVSLEKGLENLNEAFFGLDDIRIISAITDSGILAEKEIGRDNILSFFIMAAESYSAPAVAPEGPAVAIVELLKHYGKGKISGHRVARAVFDDYAVDALAGDFLRRAPEDKNNLERYSIFRLLHSSLRDVVSRLRLLRLSGRTYVERKKLRNIEETVLIADMVRHSDQLFYMDKDALKEAFKRRLDEVFGSRHIFYEEPDDILIIPQDGPAFDLRSAGIFINLVLEDKYIKSTLPKLSHGAAINLKLKAYHMLYKENKDASEVIRYIRMRIRECLEREKKLKQYPSIGFEVEVWGCVQNFSSYSASALADFFNITKGQDGAIEFAPSPGRDWRDLAETIDTMRSLGMIPDAEAEAFSLHISVERPKVFSTQQLQRYSEGISFITFVEAFLTASDERLTQEFSFGNCYIAATGNFDEVVPGEGKGFLYGDTSQIKLGNVLSNNRLEFYPSIERSCHRRALKMAQLLQIALLAYLKDKKTDKEKLLSDIYIRFREELIAFCREHDLVNFITNEDMKVTSAPMDIYMKRTDEAREAMDSIVEGYLRETEGVMDGTIATPSDTRKKALDDVLSDSKTNIRLACYSLAQSLKLEGYDTGIETADDAMRIRIEKVDPYEYFEDEDHPLVGAIVGNVPGGIEIAGHLMADLREKNVDYGEDFDIIYIFPDKNIFMDADSGDLYVRYGILVDKDRKLKIFEFTKPAPILAVIQGNRNTSKPIREFFSRVQAGLLNPPQVMEFCKDKDGFGLFLKEKGLPTPEHLALRPGISHSEIKRRIKSFIRKIKGCHFVVKPADGSMGDNVRMFGPTESSEAGRHAEYILSNGGTVLIQKRVASKEWIENGKRMDWNIRLISTWDNDRPVVDPNMIEIRYKPFDSEPVNLAKGASPLSVWQFFERMGYTKIEKERFMKDLRDVIKPAMKKLLAELKKANPGVDAYKLMPGLVGWDLIQDEHDRWFIIEANTGVVGGIQTLEKIFKNNPLKKGRAILPVLKYISQVANLFYQYDIDDDSDALDLDISRDTELLSDIGLAYSEIDPNKAALIFETITERDPDDAFGWYGLGLSLYYTGKYGRSEEAFRRAVARDGNDMESWANIGKVLSAEKRYEGAIRAAYNSLKIKGTYEFSLRLAEALRRILDRIDAEGLSAAGHLSDIAGDKEFSMRPYTIAEYRKSRSFSGSVDGLKRAVKVNVDRGTLRKGWYRNGEGNEYELTEEGKRRLERLNSAVDKSREAAGGLVGTLFDSALNLEPGEKLLLALDEEMGGAGAVNFLRSLISDIKDLKVRKELRKILKNIVIIRGRGVELTGEVRLYTSKKGKGGVKIKPADVIMVTRASNEANCLDLKDTATITFVDDSKLDMLDYYPYAEVVLFTLAKALRDRGVTGYDANKLLALYKSLNAEKMTDKRIISLIIDNKVTRVVLLPSEPFDYDELQLIYKRISEFLQSA